MPEELFYQAPYCSVTFDILTFPHHLFTNGPVNKNIILEKSPQFVTFIEN